MDRNTSRLFAVNGIFVVFYLVCTYSHVNEPDRTKKYSIIEYAVNSSIKLLIISGGVDIKKEHLKIAKQKATKIQKKADELYKLAVEKGTPVIEKSVAELKQATADALKKIVAKLETESK